MANPTPHRAKKRFGQHFLHDPNIIRAIIAAINPRVGECVVEIGPGLGAMTCPLLEKLQTLEVVELDRDVIPLLEERCGAYGQLNIHQADALKFDFGQLCSEPRGLRVVGNLPYNISTPLIFHLLDSAEKIRDMHFLLQQEVVQRITAPPGGGDYGRLSIMVQYRCKTQYLFHVGRGAFQPPPKVESAVVRLEPYTELPHRADNEHLFAQIVNQVFSQRRKTLRKSLKGLSEDRHFELVGIDPGKRPEQLSVGEFVTLSNQINQDKEA
jgi:16S rRNA (adenine1518-N6/adenine1519-N6)-dimethyltransferase